MHLTFFNSYLYCSVWLAAAVGAGAGGALYAVSAYSVSIKHSYMFGRATNCALKQKNYYLRIFIDGINCFGSAFWT